MARATFEERVAALRAKLRDEDFLANRGLGNEVGFHVLEYPPERELDMRAAVRELACDAEAGKLPCHVVVRDLWAVLLQICEQRRILDKIDALEQRRGSDALLKRLQRIATPEAFVAAMDWQPHKPGRDVLLICGVGRANPFVRAHQILENAQHVFEDVPVVLLYPGTYDGRELALFGRRDRTANYYRAFSLI